MALSDAQLLMLDTLIYTDYVKDGDSVSEIVTKMEVALANGKKIKSCEMSTAEWRELIRQIKNEESLLKYKVTNSHISEYGDKAACFVDDLANPKDVNVVFRGTSEDYEWEDNVEGGRVSDTTQQERAADYINGLPASYGNAMTVSGHSKGGNKAQYVTITTDRIARCVSFDGQGFSPEFLEKYEDKINSRANSITSISAKKDVVNCLLLPIAGRQIYIDAEEDNYLYNHKPNILLDANGNLKPQCEQDYVVKLFYDYTSSLIRYLPDDMRDEVLDVTLILVMLILGKEEANIEKALISLLEKIHLYTTDIGALSKLLLALGLPFVLQWLPIDAAVDYIKMQAEQLYKQLQAIGEKLAEFARNFVEAVDTFLNNVKEYWQTISNPGYTYTLTYTELKVDTALLLDYADRLKRVKTKILNLDKQMDQLYLKVGWRDLWSLLKADLMTGYDYRLDQCVKYLEITSRDFSKAENSIAELF